MPPALSQPPIAHEEYEESDELDVDELLDDDGDSDFAIQSRLEAPNAVMYTTRDLHLLIHQGEIDLTPPYQRGACARSHTSKCDSNRTR